MSRKKTIKKKSSKIGYMCGVDFQHEMDPHINEGIKVYNSIETLKELRTCWKQCGIIKVRVTLEKWELDQDFKREIEDADSEN